MSSFPAVSAQTQQADCWRILKKQNFPAAESFLRARERTCVSACGYFVRPEKSGHVWFLPNAAGNIASLVVQRRSSLIPVLGDGRDIPAPRFLERFQRYIPLRSFSLQGVTRSVEVFETFLAAAGLRPGVRVDFDLMYTDKSPWAGAAPRRLPGLVLRRPNEADIDALFPLQAAYEQEEILPPNAAFNPASCRLALERIIRREYTIAACLKGRIVGKANTNAESFTRYQIGGVYVHPDFRGRGIAAVMTAALVEELIARGKGVSLFVKKQNAPARAVYHRIGFMNAGDYRISYY